MEARKGRWRPERAESLGLAEEGKMGDINWPSKGRGVAGTGGVRQGPGVTVCLGQQELGPRRSREASRRRDVPCPHCGRGMMLSVNH